MGSATGAPDGGTDADAKSKTKPAPNQAAVAKRLASAVSSAPTPAARYKAVLDVMRTLHARVLSESGKALVPGGHGFPAHIYLYDFELRGMAAAIHRGDTISLSDLAELLTDAGIKPDRRDLSSTQLRQVLLAGVRKAAAGPRAASSVVPLLVRELGLRHSPSYDLLRDVPADSVRLDPLQSYLFVTDVAVAAIKRHKVEHVRRTSRGASGPAGPCSGELAAAAKEVMPFGKWAGSVIKAIKDPIKAIAITIDAIHGPALAFSVRVTSETPAYAEQTHYGPTGHHPLAGEVLRLRVKVEMLDDYGEFIVKCGGLIGMKFPKKGPIPDIPIIWVNLESSLEKHGTIAYVPANKKTGPDGIATLVFTPKDEVIPGFGQLNDVQGQVNGLATYQSAFGNAPGSIAQFITPKWGVFHWFVEFHEQSFELDFESTITYDFGALGRDVTHVRVRGLKLNAANDWENEAPLDYVSLSIHPGDCGAPATSTRLGLPFKAKLLPSTAGNPPKFAMEAFSGGAVEVLDWDCPQGGHQHLETAYWTGGFLLLHGSSTLTVDDWTYPGGSVVARKTYARTSANVSELTTFELRLAPE